MSTTGINPDGSTRARVDQLPRQAFLAEWPTPTHMDAHRGCGAPRPQDTGIPLTQMVGLAGWPTPTSKVSAGGEYKDQEKALVRVLGPHSNDLRDFAKLTEESPARITDSGELLTGSFAGMESGGLFNPGHSRWLQGYPEDWDAYAPTEIQLTSVTQQSSSELSTLYFDPLL
jgi:hypothetical protein